MSSQFSSPDWWRSAVVYQIYPRSFADANNDGIGDVPGMTSRLDHLAALGVDAVWISPWYPSPLADGGYDVADYCDIHPDFGTLADADAFIAGAHARGIRVLIDLVPNHCSDQLPQFQTALAAAPGSPERDLFVFRDGLGPGGDQPPTNWGAMFGGSMWQRVTEADGRPGQWYLHMFAPEQPDWNWRNPAVVDFFDDVLRFWFDRGVDGFRIDVADSLFIDEAWPDTPTDKHTGMGTHLKWLGAPMWDQPELVDIQRRWRAIADSYADTELGPRVFVSEAYLPGDRLVSYLATGRLHTSFNFEFLQSAWTPSSLRRVIDDSLAAHERIGASATWVLSNHDVPREVTRYGKQVTGIDFANRRFDERGEPIDDIDDDLPTADLFESLQDEPSELVLGTRRARAAALLMLALPGGAYVYQGEELVLENVDDLPEHLLQDPRWERSGHTIRGRDGCRVPIPWSGSHSPFGFSVDAVPWLPQPAHWAELSVAAQTGREDTPLELYRRALRLRREQQALGAGTMVWNQSPSEVLSFTRPGPDPVTCVTNLGPVPVSVSGEVLVASGPVEQGQLPADTTVWLRG